MNVHRWRDSRRLQRWWSSAGLIALVGCDNVIDDGDCGSQAAGISNLAVWWGKERKPNAEDDQTLLETRDPADCSKPYEPVEVENAEQRALVELQARYASCNKQVTVVVNQYRDKAALTGEMDRYMAEPYYEPQCGLPDVVQLNAGDTALKYSGCRGGGRGILAPISTDLLNPAWYSTRPSAFRDEQPKYGGNRDGGAVVAAWSERNPRVYSFATTGARITTVVEDYERWVRPYISCETRGRAEFWMAPIAVHHVNRLFYNKEKVAGLVDEFETWLEKVERHRMMDWLNELEQLAKRPNGDNVPLFAMPRDRNSRWALSLLAAENIRVALTKGIDSPNGSEVTRQATKGDSTDPATEKAERLSTARAVMDVMSRLERLAQRHVATVEEAMDLVESGGAIFTVMGDWARADVDDNLVGMVPFPGTQNTLVYTIDGFVAIDKHQSGTPAEPTLQAAAWMKVVGDGRTAWEFASTKGAVSIHDWPSHIAKCADLADTFRRDCVVIPALSMREEACRIEDALYEWIVNPYDDALRERATYQLAGCLEPPAIEYWDLPQGNTSDGGPRQPGPVN